MCMYQPIKEMKPKLFSHKYAQQVGRHLLYSYELFWVSLLLVRVRRLRCLLLYERHGLFWHPAYLCIQGRSPQMIIVRLGTTRGKPHARRCTFVACTCQPVRHFVHHRRHTHRNRSALAWSTCLPCSADTFRKSRARPNSVCTFFFFLRWIRVQSCTAMKHAHEVISHSVLNARVPCRAYIARARLNQYI